MWGGGGGGVCGFCGNLFSTVSDDCDDNTMDDGHNNNNARLRERPPKKNSIIISSSNGLMSGKAALVSTTSVVSLSHIKRRKRQGLHEIQVQVCGAIAADESEDVTHDLDMVGSEEEDDDDDDDDDEDDDDLPPPPIPRRPPKSRSQVKVRFQLVIVTPKLELSFLSVALCTGTSLVCLLSLFFMIVVRTELCVFKLTVSRFLICTSLWIDHHIGNSGKAFLPGILTIIFQDLQGVEDFSIRNDLPTVPRKARSGVCRLIKYCCCPVRLEVLSMLIFGVVLTV